MFLHKKGFDFHIKGIQSFYRILTIALKKSDGQQITIEKNNVIGVNISKVYEFREEHLHVLGSHFNNIFNHIDSEDNLVKKYAKEIYSQHQEKLFSNKEIISEDVLKLHNTLIKFEKLHDDLASLIADASEIIGNKKTFQSLYYKIGEILKKLTEIGNISRYLSGIYKIELEKINTEHELLKYREKIVDDFMKNIASWID